MFKNLEKKEEEEEREERPYHDTLHELKQFSLQEYLKRVPKRYTRA